MESQEKVEVKKLGLMLLLKARYHNTLKGLKSLIENKAVALTLPGWIVELRLFSPVLDMKFSKGFKLFERSYRMDTKLKHWKNKNFHEIVVVICGFGFGVARTSTAFLKEIAELEHMEYQLNNIPSYSTPERIKEYKDRVKKLEESSYGDN